MTTPGLRAGLCSVTLRARSAEEVVRVAAGAGLEAIEWGGDVHVPPGDDGAAGRVARWCDDAGIACASYGSYLQAGDVTDADVDRVLGTALALGAPHVRVWCRYGRGPGAGEADRRPVVASLAAIAGAAAERGLTVSLEYHPGTLTETAPSALDVLRAVDAPNLFTYWQPAPGRDPAALLAEVDAIAEHLSHLHVFRWTDDGTRLPLAAGADLWPDALTRAGGCSGRWEAPRVAFLEFVRDDDPAQVAADAAVLRHWVGR